MSINITVRDRSAGQIVLAVDEAEARQLIDHIAGLLGLCVVLHPAAPTSPLSRGLVVECWNKMLDTHPEHPSRFIYAVKLIRERAACSLADAKQAMEKEGLGFHSTNRLRP